jgi:hypothetical protein
VNKLLEEHYKKGAIDFTAEKFWKTFEIASDAKELKSALVKILDFLGPIGKQMLFDSESHSSIANDIIVQHIEKIIKYISIDGNHPEQYNFVKLLQSTILSESAKRTVNLNLPQVSKVNPGLFVNPQDNFGKEEYEVEEEIGINFSELHLNGENAHYYETNENI